MVDSTEEFDEKLAGKTKVKLHTPGEINAGNALWLFLFGVLWHSLNAFLNVGLQIEIVVGLVFLFSSIFFVFGRRGLIVNIAFVILYFAFGTISYSLLVITAFVLAVHIIIKYGLKNFGEGLGQEFVGIIPTIIFFFDINLVSILADNVGFPLTAAAQGLIRGIPWWGALGAFIGLQQEHTEGILQKILKFVAFLTVVYLIFTLIFTYVPNYGYEIQLPNVDDIQQRRDQIQAKASESVFASQLKCIKDPTNFKGCVESEQAKSKCSEYDENTEEHNECLAIAQGREVDVTGTLDRYQDSTTFVIEENLGTNRRRVERIDPTDAQPFTLTVENPKKQDIIFHITCTYKTGNREILGAPLNEIEVDDDNNDPFQFACRGTEPLPAGTGQWVVEVTAIGLTTTTWQERFFIGDLEDQEDDVKNYWFGEGGTGSRGAQDYVRLDFSIGNELIRTENPQLNAKIVNTGNGEIMHIETAFIAAPLQPTQGCRVQMRDSGLELPRDILTKKLNTAEQRKQKQIRFDVCDLDIDSALRFPPRPVHMYIEAFIVYNYKITEEFSVIVNNLEVTV